MHIQNILADKGHSVARIRPNATTCEAARAMVANNVGALLVMDRDDRIVGIVSERDLARALAGTRDVGDLLVGDVMTRDVLTCSPNDTVVTTMGLMTTRRVRHLPVLDDQRQLCGIVSIGDLVKRRLGELRAEADAMQQYISVGR